MNLSKAQPDYRPDIDGLRAIAVLLVIGFHAFPSALPGGYIGVDVFFVISGFLITGLLLHDLKRKQFSFSRFYARRIRRIFPALVVVLAVCFGAGWILLLPHDFSSLGINIFGGAAFSSNLVLLGQAGYFDVSAAQKPLLHLWSLGVEEQFYIFWPLVLLLAFARRLSILLCACVLFALSFAINLTMIGTPAAFYLPFTRAWELMIGGALAAFSGEHPNARLQQRLEQFRAVLRGRLPTTLVAIGASPDVRGVIGVGLIGVAAFALGKASNFPGWLALLPTLGTTLILTSANARLNRIFLANPAAVLVGLISYPLYLWHWPLLSYATIIEPTGPSRWARAFAILLAAALALLTYYWIERPVRLGAWRYKIASLCAAMCSVGALGLITVYTQGFSFRVPAAFRDVGTIPLDRVAQWRLGLCFLDEINDSPDGQFSPDCLERNRRPLLFMWGDSFSAALYPGLKNLQRSVNFAIAQYSTAGCPPLIDFPVKARPYCVKDDDYALSALTKAHPDIVLLYSAWNQGDVYSHLSNLISRLRELKIPRIIVMGPPPEWAGGLAKAAYDYWTHNPLHRMIPLYSNFRVDQGWYQYQREFQLHVKQLGVEYISTWDALCRDSDCRTWVDAPGGSLMAFDEAHLTIPGSLYLAQAISPCLFTNQADTRPTFCTGAPQSAAQDP